MATIFGMLEHAGADPAVVQRVFTTPHGVALAPLAAAYGARHVAVTDDVALRDALASAPVGVEIVEVVLDGALTGAGGGV